MASVLVIGGTRFIGRHVVRTFLERGDDLTLFNRGRHTNPFADDDRVDHVPGDRTEREALADAAERVDPDVVVDCVAFRPDDVHTAIDLFAGADAYVYVSSVAAYESAPVIKYEDETPLQSCSPAEASDDSMATYGPRKAAGDRAIRDAPGPLRAMSVRPSMVYGPHDYIGHMAYWVDRVAGGEPVLVPGDGTTLCHRSFVEDVASAIRVVVESGTGGTAYNAANRQPLTLDGLVRGIADVLDVDVSIVHVDATELEEHDLSPTDFPYVRDRPPFVLSTARLASLGWTSTSHDRSLDRTTSYVLENGIPEDLPHPERHRERQVLDAK